MIYIENNSMDAAFSFAVEYYLLKELDLGEDAFMFWRTKPTLMIGCYQNAAVEVNLAYAHEKGVPIVRRITGGGTIYTDEGGWQFSFISRGKPQTEIDFRVYMQPVVDALANLGVQATFSDRNDILVDGRKVSGNAQYRSASCTLHHGSILFNTNFEEMVRLLTVSDEKLISKGIKSVRQRVTNVLDHLENKMDALEFKEKMLASLLARADHTYVLTPLDLARVNEIAQSKFRKWDWNFGESPKFEITKSNRFAGGKIECNLNIAGGRIAQCKIFGDFFSAGDIEILQNSLVGCTYRADDIRAVLERVNASDFFFMISLDELMSCII